MKLVVLPPSLWVLVSAPRFSTSITSAACVSPAPSPSSVPICTRSTQKLYILSNLALFPEGIGSVK